MANWEMARWSAIATRVATLPVYLSILIMYTPEGGLNLPVSGYFFR